MSLDLLRLTHWLSPTFPAGAYAYSQGLEWALGPGGISDAAGVEALQDAVLMSLALEPGADLGRLSDLALGMAPSAGRLREMNGQGRAFGLTLAAMGQGGGEALPLPIAVGRAARGLDLPKTVIIAQYLRGWALNLATVAVRAVPLGQSEGQRTRAGVAAGDPSGGGEGGAGGGRGSRHLGLWGGYGRDSAGKHGGEDLPDMTQNGPHNGPLRVGIGGPVGAGKTR